MTWRSRRERSGLSLALGVAAGLACATARADGVNVEQHRPDRPGVSGNLDFKLGYRQGNVNRVDIGLKSRISVLTGRHLVLLLTDSRFASQSKARDGGSVTQLGSDEARFANRHMAHVRYNVRMWDWLASEVFSQIETDEFLLLQTRVLFGAGPRFVLFENDEFGGYLGTTYMAEYERLDRDTFVAQPSGRGARTWWHRSSTYLSLRFLATDRLILASTTYVQPRFDNFADVRVVSDSSLEVSLATRLALKLGVSIRHDSRPPTACSEDLGIACAADDSYQLQRTDVLVDNALSLKF